MGEQQPSRKKIDRRLAGPALIYGGHSIQPIAQMNGWQWTNRQPGAEMGGAAVQLRPVAFLVHENGVTRTIPVLDPLHSSLVRLVRLAALVMLSSWLIMWVARRSERHR